MSQHVKALSSQAWSPEFDSWSPFKDWRRGSSPQSSSTSLGTHTPKQTKPNQTKTNKKNTENQNLPTIMVTKWALGWEHNIWEKSHLQTICHIPKPLPSHSPPVLSVASLVLKPPSYFDCFLRFWGNSFFFSSRMHRFKEYNLSKFLPGGTELLAWAYSLTYFEHWKHQCTWNK